MRRRRSSWRSAPRAPRYWNPSFAVWENISCTFPTCRSRGRQYSMPPIIAPIMKSSLGSANVLPTKRRVTFLPPLSPINSRATPRFFSTHGRLRRRRQHQRSRHRACGCQECFHVGLCLRKRE